MCDSTDSTRSPDTTTNPKILETGEMSSHSLTLVTTLLDNIYRSGKSIGKNTAKLSNLHKLDKSLPSLLALIPYENLNIGYMFIEEFNEENINKLINVLEGIKDKEIYGGKATRFFCVINFSKKIDPADRFALVSSLNNLNRALRMIGNYELVFFLDTEKIEDPRINMNTIQNVQGIMALSDISTVSTIFPVKQKAVDEFSKGLSYYIEA